MRQYYIQGKKERVFSIQPQFSIILHLESQQWGAYLEQPTEVSLPRQIKNIKFFENLGFETLVKTPLKLLRIY